MITELTGNLGEYAARLLLAAFLGGLIGFERDIRGRAAGLRTLLLVSLGAAVFVIMSESWASLGQIGPGRGPVLSDPGRVAAQVVTGIGFLGAGAIMKEGLAIRGLTTAACLWVVAGIGMASGAGHYFLALAATIIALGSLVGLQYVERFYQKDSYRVLTIVTTNDVDIGRIIDTVQGEKLKVIFFNFDRNYVDSMTTVKLSLRLFHRGITDKFAHGIVKSLEEADIPLRAVKWDHP